MNACPTENFNWLENTYQNGSIENIHGNERFTDNDIGSRISCLEKIKKNIVFFLGNEGPGAVCQCHGASRRKKDGTPKLKNVEPMKVIDVG